MRSSSLTMWKFVGYSAIQNETQLCNYCFTAEYMTLWWFYWWWTLKKNPTTWYKLYCLWNIFKPLF